MGRGDKPLGCNVKRGSSQDEQRQRWVPWHTVDWAGRIGNVIAISVHVILAVESGTEEVPRASSPLFESLDAGRQCGQRHVKKQLLTSAVPKATPQPGHLRCRELRLRSMQGLQNMW